MTDTTTIAPLFAISLPTSSAVLVCLLGVVLPIIFFLWLNSWLSSVRDEHPDQVIDAQAKADRDHAASRGGHGQVHGHSAPTGSHHALS